MARIYGGRQMPFRRRTFTKIKNTLKTFVLRVFFVCFTHLFGLASNGNVPYFLPLQKCKTTFAARSAYVIHTEVLKAEKNLSKDHRLSPKMPNTA